VGEPDRIMSSGDAVSLEAALDEAIATFTARRSNSDEPPPPEPLAVNLDALPPIESIDAATDISSFLAPGVPAELTAAAVRRAWGADPEVSEFVGPVASEPEPGRPDEPPGLLDPFADVGRLVDRLVAEDRGPAPPPPATDPA
jgi:hypothetical protein